MCVKFSNYDINFATPQQQTIICITLICNYIKFVEKKNFNS